MGTLYEDKYTFFIISRSFLIRMTISNTVKHNSVFY